MSRAAWAGAAAAGALLLWLLGHSAAGPGDDPAVSDVSPGLSVTGLLATQSDEETGAADSGFARALSPRPFSFPADHGSHPDFQTEWWYYTGNLTATDPAEEARQFGFQLTFFRFALEPPTDSGAAAPAVVGDDGPARSRWRTRQVYMAHFALTDAATGRFHSAERFGREALDLAGATVRPFAVWLGDWRSSSTHDPAPGGSGSIWPVALRASGDGAALELALEPLKAPVFNGNLGLSQKSAAPGNASYYYTYSRLRAAGAVTVDGRRFEVRGFAWKDREWSTSALAPDQAGWDWFSLQLSDDSELMMAYLRTRDGRIDAYSHGTLVLPDGSTRHLNAADTRLEVLDRWTSAATGVEYPARWRLEVPAAGLDLEVAPLVPDQEMRHSVRYWEGAVTVSGAVGEQRVSGRGYVELAGY